MKNKKRGIWKSSLLIIIVFASALLVLQKINFNQELERYESDSVENDIDIPILEADLEYGGEEAQIDIFMFSSYKCDACLNFFNGNFKKLEKEFISTDKVRFIVKNIELEQEVEYLFGLQALACVEKYNGNLYLHNYLLEPNNSPEDDIFINKVKEYNHENSELNHCIKKQEHFDEIQSNNKLYQNIGLSGTPSFIIGNRIYKGNVAYPIYKKIILKSIENL